MRSGLPGRVGIAKHYGLKIVQFDQLIKHHETHANSIALNPVRIKQLSKFYKCDPWTIKKCFINFKSADIVFWKIYMKKTCSNIKKLSDEEFDNLVKYVYIDVYGKEKPKPFAQREEKKRSCV